MNVKVSSLEETEVGVATLLLLDAMNTTITDRFQELRSGWKL